MDSIGTPTHVVHNDWWIILILTLYWAMWALITKRMWRRELIPCRGKAIGQMACYLNDAPLIIIFKARTKSLRVANINSLNWRWHSVIACRPLLIIWRDSNDWWYLLLWLGRGVMLRHVLASTWPGLFPGLEQAVIGASKVTTYNLFILQPRTCAKKVSRSRTHLTFIW